MSGSGRPLLCRGSQNNVGKHKALNKNEVRMTQPSDDFDVAAIDIQRVLELLPHRYPFLLVDKMERLVHAKSARGIKNVTFNEPFFQGHFLKPAGHAWRDDC